MRKSRHGRRNVCLFRKPLPNKCTMMAIRNVLIRSCGALRMWDDDGSGTDNETRRGLHGGGIKTFKCLHTKQETNKMSWTRVLSN